MTSIGECAPPLLADALDALLRARQRVAEAMEDADRAKAEMVQTAISYVNASLSETELLERASFVYWNVGDVHVSDLAAIVVGDGKKKHQFLAKLPPASAIILCEDCGCGVPAKSRSQLAETQKSRFRFLCAQCRSARKASQSAEFELHRRQEVERQRDLQSMPYREYLQTPEWFGTRMSKLRQSGFRCQLCNVGGLLDVHHRTYERRGAEWLSDLIVLCRACHGKFHDKL